MWRPHSGDSSDQKSAPITSERAAAAYLEGLIDMERRPEASDGRMGLEAVVPPSCLSPPKRGA